MPVCPVPPLRRDGDTCVGRQGSQIPSLPWDRPSPLPAFAGGRGTVVGDAVLEGA